MIHIHGCSKKELHVHDFKFAKLTKNTVVSTWLEDETVKSHLFDDGSPSGGVFEKEKKNVFKMYDQHQLLAKLNVDMSGKGKGVIL